MPRGRGALREGPSGALWPLDVCPLRCPLDICPLGGHVGARVGGARWVRGRMEREWNGRRGRGMGGSGILGLLGHADRRALIGP
jgi:hypothetical protein